MINSWWLDVISWMVAVLNFDALHPLNKLALKFSKFGQYAKPAGISMYLEREISPGRDASCFVMIWQMLKQPEMDCK